MRPFRRREGLTCAVIKPNLILRQPLDKNLPTTIMNPPVLQLEEYFLTRLHVDYTFPPGAPQVEVKQTECNFDYETGTHVTDQRLRMLRLKGLFRELDANNQAVGHRIECEILGFFSFTDTTPKGKEEVLLRVNGVSVLYGALRGILGIMSGSFPGGRFRLPNIMPQEIVADIEKRRAE